MKEKKWIRSSVLLLLSCLLVSASFSQNTFKVSGKVSDDAGKPVSGASVLVKGTTVGTTTGADGGFELNAPSGKSVLVISSVGYTDQEIEINNRNTINVTLASGASTLEDVVVIGYASVKKKDVTGSVSGINQKEIRSRPVDNALQAMQGKVAGVDITSNERPGTLGSIRIRGERSLNATNDPLYVVDNIPLATGGIEYINPNDIESIDVLKDASATAIYGSRGANGVVIVTTKQGKAGKTQVNFFSSATFETVRDWAPIMSASEYIDFRRWAVYYSNPTGRPRGDAPTIANDRDIFLATSDPDAWKNIAKGWAGGTWDGTKVGNTDWTGLVSQTGITTDNTISVSGGTNKIKAYGSFGYLNNKGTSIGQKFIRYSGKTSVEVQATDWFSMGVNFNVTYGIQEFGQSNLVIGSFVGSPATSIYNSARGLFKWAVPYDSVGNRILYPGGDVAIKTVIGEEKYTQDQRATLRAFGSMNAQLDFGKIHPALKGLKYRFNFGPDFSNYSNGVYIDGQSAASSGINGASLQEAKTYSWTLDNLIYYNREIKKHNFGVTLLQSATKYVASPVNRVVGTGIPFAAQKWYELNSSVLPSTNLTINRVTPLQESQLSSYMARVNYGFDERYLLTASLRYDAASQLGEGYKGDFFPSAALAWRLSRENFMQNVAFVNDLKFRVGVGVTGNSAIGPYQTLTYGVPYFYANGGSVIPASLPTTQLGNPNLRWEKTAQYNVGIDFSILKNRISGVIDVYTSKTKDLIFPQRLPTVTGYSTTLTNLGQTSNRGVDVNINTVNISEKNFQWTSGLNVSFQKDRIDEGANGKQDDILNNYFIGQPIRVIYGFSSNGMWQYSDTATLKKFAANGNTFTPGQVKPNDLNGDNKIDANNDRGIIGNTRPQWVVGLTNSFSYKGVELSFFIYGRLKYWYNTGGEAQTARGNQRQIDYWTENNQDAEYQKPFYSVGSGDNYSGALGYKKGSFIKVRNVSLAYNFNSKMIKSMHMQNLRVYFQATNPAMLYSQIKFMDMDAVSMFSNRGFTVGINAGF
ncbi:SusC/RagA family TonB-linked outer membrane protein [Lacibacter luteus]|uniref:SusC/RagA family TonB-linked outer membrane protein n=1 Tax=Lacibacter luteus TaxID=2508719 RepID=A0A4Q1CLC5_9BACT|nr:SusC/RagA family TonB-linked outer membrane protein [Lacibacter luteus]RXK61807.1 SusC/RagA family TonB-linked outer membrane protein [Lacibacter luteus]